MDGIITEKIPVNRFFRKRIKFHFGMYVWVAVAEKHNVFFDELSKIPSDELTCDMLYFAARLAQFNSGRRPTVKRATIERALSLMPARQYGRIIKQMEGAQFGGKSIMKIADEVKKKQATKK